MKTNKQKKLEGLYRIPQTFAIPSVVLRPAELASIGSLLEMQNLRLHPRPTESDHLLYKITEHQKFEKCCLKPHYLHVK